jgi:hypothetical protein
MLWSDMVSSVCPGLNPCLNLVWSMAVAASTIRNEGSELSWELMSQSESASIWDILGVVFVVVFFGFVSVELSRSSTGLVLCDTFHTRIASTQMTATSVTTIQTVSNAAVLDPPPLRLMVVAVPGNVGAAVGAGIMTGLGVGALVDGPDVGFDVGENVGCLVGSEVGKNVGCLVGEKEGWGVGGKVGAGVGDADVDDDDSGQSTPPHWIAKQPTVHWTARHAGVVQTHVWMFGSLPYETLWITVVAAVVVTWNLRPNVGPAAIVL